jgi:hypothetical protein
MTLDMLCIAYKKLLWSNSNLKKFNVPNLVTFVQILLNFSWDVSVSKQRRCQSAQNVLNFLPQPRHKI